MKRIAVSLLIIVGITFLTIKLFSSDVVILEGTFSSDNVQLYINFESDYQVEVDENNEMNSWSYHEGYFIITASKGNKLGKDSYVEYKNKKLFFEGIIPDKQGFFKKSKRIVIKNEKEFSNFTCHLAYTIKSKTGKTTIIKKTLSVSSKSRDGKLTIKEVRK